MAEKTIEELASDFTATGGTPAGISDSILTPTGGGGGGGGRNEYVPPYAIDPYTSPYIRPRVVVFTINTYANLSKKGVLAKAFLDGVEVEDQTISKGKITFTINEQRLLNPSTLTIVSGDLKAEKYFLIQCRKDAENEVSIIEYSNTEESPVAATPAIPVVIETPVFGGGAVDVRGGQFDGSGGSGGGSGGGSYGGGGGMREVNPNDFRGAGFGLADVTQRENLQ
jgi:hypothetical protein